MSPPTTPLANIQTAGFKPDFSFTIPRQAARLEEGLFNLPSNALLERLGGGILLSPNKTSFSQGPITHTRNAFDLAIQGNGFFTSRCRQGFQPLESVQLTRDGRLTLDARQGRLVTATGGKRVLDANGQPITLNPALDFQVHGDGTIAQGGQTAATLGFFDVPNRDLLTKIGDNTFVLPAGAAGSRTPAFESGGRVVQNAIEESSADPMRSLMDVQGVGAPSRQRPSPRSCRPTTT